MGVRRLPDTPTDATRDNVPRGLRRSRHLFLTPHLLAAPVTGKAGVISNVCLFFGGVSGELSLSAFGWQRQKQSSPYG